MSQLNRLSPEDDTKFFLFWHLLTKLYMMAGILPKEFPAIDDEEFEHRLTFEITPGAEDDIDPLLLEIADLLDVEDRESHTHIRQAVVDYMTKNMPQDLTCFHIIQIAPMYMDDALPIEVANIARKHLMQCVVCSNLCIENQLGN